MRTYSQFLEDLEQRKVALAQRRQQQMARIKQQNAQSASDTEERISVAKQQSAAGDEAEARREVGQAKCHRREKDQGGGESS